MPHCSTCSAGTLNAWRVVTIRDTSTLNRSDGLLEGGALPQHTEAAAGRHQRRLQRAEHQGDVDDLAVVGHQRDVLALVEQQVVQRR